ncbi:MAG: adenylate kinase [Parvularculales bacterium]
MRIVFLGPPGAGKGTQAMKISVAHGLAHLSTGDILREEVDSESDLGCRVKDIMARGDLVPDDLVTNIIGTRVATPDCARGFVLDGFPRTLSQAEMLDEMLMQKDMTLDAVIELNVNEEELSNRIAGRTAETQGDVRVDDSVEILRNRLAVYREQTLPLSGYYETRGLLRSVDGMAGIDEVNRQIEAVLGS